MNGLVRSMFLQAAFLLLAWQSSPNALFADEVPEKVLRDWQEQEKQAAKIEVKWKGAIKRFVSEEELTTGVKDPAFVPKTYHASAVLSLSRKQSHPAVTESCGLSKWQGLSVFDDGRAC